MTYNGYPPRQPQWGAPPPYPPRFRPPAPKWARKRIVLPALVISWFIGLAMGLGDEASRTAPAAIPKPAVTVTVTITPTAEPKKKPAAAIPTASPKPKVPAKAPAKAPIKAPTKAAPPPVAEPAPTADENNSTVYYQNCDAARAAGAAPLYRGDPGYASHLDRDNDGDACE